MENLVNLYLEITKVNSNLKPEVQSISKVAEPLDEEQKTGTSRLLNSIRVFDEITSTDMVEEQLKYLASGLVNQYVPGGNMLKPSDTARVKSKTCMHVPPSLES